MLFTAPKFVHPLDFTTAIFSFFGWGAHHKIAQFVAVYIDATLDDATKIKIAEGLGYTKVEDPVNLPTDEQRQQMSKFTDELIEQLLIAANEAVTRDRDRLADVQQQLGQSEYNVLMLQGEMKHRKENNRV